MLSIRVFCVAYSMGRVVIKKILILAKQYPARWGLASCVHSMFFLATPHRGADSAKLRSNILRLPSGMVQSHT